MNPNEAAARRRAARIAAGDLCAEADCPNPRATRGLCKTHYNHTVPAGTLDLDKRRATWRAKNHRRRQASRAAFDELTPARELELRRKAKRCPMPGCGVRLVDEPYLPPSKELDHIVPRNVGGTHTMGNVRIVCRSCNLGRPKDGSDYSGPVTLWAQDHEVAGERAWRGFCVCGTRKRDGRCHQCRPPRPSRKADGQRAAELRADGWHWRDIANSFGLTPTNVAGIARRHGDPLVVARWPEDDPFCHACGDDLPRGGRGRPRKYCTQCRPAGQLPSVTLERVTSVSAHT